MNDKVLDKLQILSAAAKYDVSCSSSGSSRVNDGGIGNAAKAGICHSFTEDGRCISLLKILMTNNCIYDCAYCINRRSNDIQRAAFTVEEIVDLTINFYRRNYIEGLFLSSGVMRNPDFTMERLTHVAKELRTTHRYNGYIHLKAIPGASRELVHEAGLYADRLSVNIEIPSEQNLKMLAPDKDYQSVFTPMNQVSEQLAEYGEDKKNRIRVPRFVPAGQSTQLIVGATPDNDLQILKLASGFYNDQHLKRVYYSGFMPVNNDSRLPVIQKPPLVRENRLYQADWLMRFYQFSFDEIVNEQNPTLELDMDPKLAYALRNPWMFPIDLNTASYEQILRVPGIGVRSAKMIVHSRQFGGITLAHLKKMGVATNRAKFFITCRELPANFGKLYPEQIRRMLREKRPLDDTQLSLF